MFFDYLGAGRRSLRCNIGEESPGSREQSALRNQGLRCNIGDGKCHRKYTAKRGRFYFFGV